MTERYFESSNMLIFDLEDMLEFVLSETHVDGDPLEYIFFDKIEIKEIILDLAEIH